MTSISPDDRNTIVVRTLERAMDEFRSKHPLYSLIYWIYFNRGPNFYEVDTMVYRLIYRIQHSDGILPYSVEYKSMIVDIAHHTDEILSRMVITNPFPEVSKPILRHYIGCVSRTYDGYIDFINSLNLEWLLNLLQ